MGSPSVTLAAMKTWHAVLISFLIILALTAGVGLVGYQLVYKPAVGTGTLIGRIIGEINAEALRHDGWEVIEGLTPDERAVIRAEILAAVQARFGAEPKDGWIRPLIIQVLDNGRRYAVTSSGVSSKDPSDDIILSDPPSEP